MQLLKSFEKCYAEAINLIQFKFTFPFLLKNYYISSHKCRTKKYTITNVENEKKNCKSSKMEKRDLILDNSYIFTVF